MSAYPPVRGGGQLLGGGTGMLAACLDGVRVLTLHVEVVWSGLARLYYLELSLLHSLWHLFR